MATTNYLDKTGLGLLWAKIKSKFYTKTEVDVLIPEIEQSDWSENDNTSPAYVQNRTHYTEDPVLTELFTYSNESIDTYYEIYLEDYSWIKSLEDGAPYSVVLNGTTYTGNPRAAFGGFCIGNASISDGSMEDTGEPFLIYISNDGYDDVTLTTLEEQNNGVALSVSVEVSNIHKLDSKYLDGSLLTSGYGFNSEVFNGLQIGSYESYSLNISGVAGSTEYSFVATYDFSPMPLYWANICPIITIVGYEATKIVEIYSEDGLSGTLYLDSTLDAENDINGVTISITTPSKYAYGQFSHAEGDNTKAVAYASHAEGSFTTASGDYSHTEGNSTTASGYYSHAEGYNTTASGASSHAEGGDKPATMNLVIKLTGDAKATTYSVNSITIDSVNVINTIKTLNGLRISGHKVIAETFTDGRLSTIILDGTLSNTAVSNKSYSISSGINIASGRNSHAEGSFNYASGINSHAEGVFTIASSNYQHAQGRWNIEDSNNTYADIVGNGSTSARSNAYTLDWSGNGWYAGKLTVGAAPTNAMDVATKQYVDSATAGVSPNLSGLADTTISNPTDGQVLKYDSASSKWINEDAGGGVLYVTITGNVNDGFSTTANFDDVYAAYQAGSNIKAINGSSIYNLSTATSSGMSFTKNTNTNLMSLTWTKSSGNVSYTNTNLAQLNLNSLSDATVSSPSAGQILTYDATTSKWVNTTSSYVTATQVNELIATALAAYGDGDTATYGYSDGNEVDY